MSPPAFSLKPISLIVHLLSLHAPGKHHYPFLSKLKISFSLSKSWRTFTSFWREMFWPSVMKTRPGYTLLWYVSSQITLTADELIFHKICATCDIETILGRFGPQEVPHAGKWYRPDSHLICIVKKGRFFLSGIWYFWVQIWNIHEILQCFCVSHIKN